MMENNDKTFFTPGQVVILRQEIDNKPKMIVIEKVTKNFMNKDNDKSSLFVGIRCAWFDKNQVYREGIFSTKDLIHV